MSDIFDCRDEAQLLAGLRHARRSIARGELVVLPTDTVYGVAADAFSPAAITALLAAKGRGRQSPPPVLVSGAPMLAALVSEVPEPIEGLIGEVWPGGLTIVLPSQPSLAWDLGETHGTVAVRMPDNRVTLDLIQDAGPLAVSSANLTGRPAATSVLEAERMLRSSVKVYLDDGPSSTGVASTIIDATALARREKDARVRVLREGAVSTERLRELLGGLLESDASESDARESDTTA